MSRPNIKAYVPQPDERKYNGTEERSDCCIVAVPNWSQTEFYQCRYPRGYGPGGRFCKRHAKRIREKKLHLAR